MKIGDELYNKHFRQMVLDGILCGLYHPIEMVENYGRGIGQDYSKIQEIDQFCYFAIKEFYATIYLLEVKDVTIEMCNEWTKEFYTKRK